MANNTLVTGLFKSKTAAEAAYNSLTKHGFAKDDITVLMSDATRTKEFVMETRTSAASGAGIGSAIGGTVGAALAAIIAVGTTLVIPGLNLVIVGPLVAALAGAGAGGATGGIIGALVGAGIPEHRAKAYDVGLREGGILIGVEARSDEEADQLETLIKDLGAEGVKQE